MFISSRRQHGLGERRSVHGLTREQERGHWLQFAFCLFQRSQHLVAANFFADLVLGPAFQPGATPWPSVPTPEPSVSQEARVDLEALDKRGDTEQGWEKWKRTMKPKDARVVQVSTKASWADALEQDTREDEDSARGKPVRVSDLLTRIQPVSLFGVPDCFQNCKTQRSATACPGNKTLKTAAAISSEAAVAGAPSLLDKRAAKSLLASCSESDESCGGGTGIVPMPHSSPSRVSCSESRVTPDVGPQTLAGFGENWLGETRSTGDGQGAKEMASGICEADRLTFLEGAALRVAVLKALGEQTESGMSAQQVLERMQKGGVKAAGAVPAIKKLLEQLVNEGEAFNTTDDDHFTGL